MNAMRRIPPIAFSVCVLLLFGAAPAVAQWTSYIEVRTSIVWPHDDQGHETSVAQSQAVNVSIWPTQSIGCIMTPDIQLLMARDNEVTVPVGGEGQTIFRATNGGVFPSVEFNDIPVNLRADPGAKYAFLTFGYLSRTVQGFSGNVWVHALDPRTFYPDPVAPKGFGDDPRPPQGADARIQIVWPHDEQGAFAPVERATRVNIAVEIFEHGTLKAIPPDSSGDYLVSPGMLMAEGNDPLKPIITLSFQRVTYTVNGQTFPRWVLNDIPVQPGKQYHFVAWAITAQGTEYPYATVWTHAPDARTDLPNPLPAPPCVPPSTIKARSSTPL